MGAEAVRWAAEAARWVRRKRLCCASGWEGEESGRGRRPQQTGLPKGRQVGRQAGGRRPGKYSRTQQDNLGRRRGV